MTATQTAEFRNKKQRKQQHKLRKPGFARAKYVRMSPRKVRLVVDLIRGKSVRDAEDILRFLPHIATRQASAIASSSAPSRSSPRRSFSERANRQVRT